jgi:hypothetical protein
MYQEAHHTMAPAEQPERTDYAILSPDEAFAIFHYQATLLMNMSVEEFLRRWEAHE